MTATDTALDLLNAGHIADALPMLSEAAFRDPCYKTYLNYGVGLRYSGNLEAALAWFVKAVILDPRPPNAYLSLGNVSTDLGEWEHALGYYDSAFRRSSGADPAALRQIAIAYSQALLRAHRFTDAWPLWEMGRFDRSYFALPGTKRWLGEPCESLLVVCEGGYGDAMLFARWLSLLPKRAKHVSLIIWDRMSDFRDWWALGIDEVIPKSAEVATGTWEYTTSWMSLPAIFGMKSLADIPPDLLYDGPAWDNAGSRTRRSYVAPEPSLNRIGYCWRAEENLTLRPVRSLDAESAQQLADSLGKYGEVASLTPAKGSLYNARDFAIPSGIVQDEALIDGWQATTTTIRSCRFVVTVDTAVAHLAGLCGVPTLLLLPCASDWKWGTAENQPTDPWYGPHVRYYRNRDPLKWNVEEIVEAVGVL